MLAQRNHIVQSLHEGCCWDRDGFFLDIQDHPVIPGEVWCLEPLKKSENLQKGDVWEIKHVVTRYLDV